jgi:uncharacterized protein YhhL (DUF1145 family)
MNADQNLVNLRNLLIFIHGVELALMKSPSKIGRRLTLMNADQNLVNLRNLLIFIHGVELGLMKSPLKIGR